MRLSKPRNAPVAQRTLFRRLPKCKAQLCQWLSRSPNQGKPKPLELRRDGGLSLAARNRSITGARALRVDAVGDRRDGQEAQQDTDRRAHFITSALLRHRDSDEPDRRRAGRAPAGYHAFERAKQDDQGPLDEWPNIDRTHGARRFWNSCAPALALLKSSPKSRSGWSGPPATSITRTHYDAARPRPKADGRATQGAIRRH